MEYIELLGIDSPFFKSKLIQVLSSIPSSYSSKEIKLIIDQLEIGQKIRFEFDLPHEKAIDFSYNLMKQGILIGDSSIHEEREN